MKQGKQFMKAIMLVLALMVASYILYNVVRSASSGVPTAQAVLYAASDGVSVEGFVVRQETVIPAAYDLVLPTKGEGERRDKIFGCCWLLTSASIVTPNVVCICVWANRRFKTT